MIYFYFTTKLLDFKNIFCNKRNAELKYKLGETFLKNNLQDDISLIMPNKMKCKYL